VIDNGVGSSFGHLCVYIGIRCIALFNLMQMRDFYASGAMRGIGFVDVDVNGNVEVGDGRRQRA
jgi:hypothetical protein